MKKIMLIILDVIHGVNAWLKICPILKCTLYENTNILSECI